MALSVNELQIGDLVNLNGHRIYKVTPQIFECSGWVLEPIPLTSEILEKNGFISYPQDRIVIWRNDYSFAIECDLTTWEYYWANGDVKINYVHELQRALRCCGLWDLADSFVV